jgi:acetylglutamate kinase
MEDLKVFKIGGKVVDDPDSLRAFVKDFAAVKCKKILVHGGGKSVTEMSQRLGIEVKMIQGRRITDGPTLEVVKMMLAGVANKNVVSLLQANGVNAIGMTGADGDAILANRRPVKNGIDYGYVGDVERVSAHTISKLINLNLVPVFAAMTHDGQGQLFNTNADTIASSLAVGLSVYFAVELIYCFELNGVLRSIEDPQSVIQLINSNIYTALKEDKTINEGMIPKIDNAFDALNAGVRAVRIGSAARIGDLTREDMNFGTKIVL